MSPSRLTVDDEDRVVETSSGGTNGATESAVFHRDLRHTPPKVRGAGCWYIVGDEEWKMIDASCGAGVASLGNGSNKRVRAAMDRQRDEIPYVPSTSFTTDIEEKFTQYVKRITNGQMVRVFLCGSGSEANESAIKLAVQFWVDREGLNTKRFNFISRWGSYHGATLGALAASGHRSRRKLFEPLLCDKFQHVSACHPYHDRNERESDDEYNARKAKELDDKIQALGKDTVAAFIAEPVIGAARGCVTAPAGYFKAIKEVCDRYEILLIFDEVMCGMGRTGKLNAWEWEGVIPDIQVVGKGLTAGYENAAGMLVGRRVVSVVKGTTGVFKHGFTFQNNPIHCAAALEVLKIVEDEGLLANACQKGELLERLLKDQLQDHPYVGDIRGRGLFWAIEFVKDKKTKQPFPHQELISWKLFDMGKTKPYGIHLYPGAGTKDDVDGDHLMIMPQLNVTEDDLREMVRRAVRLINDFFKKF